MKKIHVSMDTFRTPRDHLIVYSPDFLGFTYTNVCTLTHWSACFFRILLHRHVVPIFVTLLSSQVLFLSAQGPFVHRGHLCPDLFWNPCNAKAGSVDKLMIFTLNFSNGLYKCKTGQFKIHDMGYGSKAGHGKVLFVMS